MHSWARHIALVVLGLSASFAQAGEPPARFTLGRYVPGDAWMLVHAVHNPERAWIEAQWVEVWEALKQTGIHTDIIELIVASVGADQRAEAEGHMEKIHQLLEGVRWEDMFGGEVAFARSLGVPLLDPMLLTRGVNHSAEANLEGLLAILRYLASFSEDVSVKTEKVHGIDVWSLKPVKEKKDFPVALELFRKGEIIGITGSRNATDNILGLMAGAPGKRAIVDNDRFKQALAAIKSPEDYLMFFDFRMMMQGIDRLINVSLDQASANNQAKALGKAIAKALALFDCVDYVVETMETKGRREFTHTLARMQADKMDSPITRMCINRRPFQRFDTYIPADATGFSLSGSIDLALLYRTVLDFIEHEVPEGVGLIEKYNGFLAGHGFDPERDLFSWLSGEYISVSMPAAMVTPMGGSSDSVLLVRVKNAGLAMEKVGAAIDRLSGVLQGLGQTLMISPAAVNAEGFREVTHPMAAMFIRPVVGVKDDYLMVATSAQAINKCLDVAAGKAPSILENERFQKEGIKPTGPVMAASFSDMSNLGTEMGGAVGIIGMVLGMVTAGIPETPETHTQKQAMQKILGMVMKLAPVLQKIDFYSSSSSVTTRDGIFVRTEKVTTYKAPAPGDTKTVSAPPPVN